MCNLEYATKTEIYQKIKKPLLERQRRKRIKKCLDGLKQLMMDLNGSNKILSMGKAEMLETTIVFFRQHIRQQNMADQQLSINSFRNGYMNAVNEVSRVLASTPGITVEMGKSVMKRLGRFYNKLQHQQYKQRKQLQISKHRQQLRQQKIEILTTDCPLSPASAGYQSDDYDSTTKQVTAAQIWRPW